MEILVEWFESRECSVLEIKAKQPRKKMSSRHSEIVEFKAYEKCNRR